MERPKIKLKLSAIDYLLDVGGAIFIITMISLAVYYYGKLPDTVPIHFNATGEPDNYGDKSLLWVLSGFEVALFISILILSRFPHLLNYPIAINQENILSQYRLGARLLRVVNLITAMIFCYIIFTITQTAMDNSVDLSGWFMPIVFIALFGTVIVYFYKAFNQKKASHSVPG